MIYLGSQLWFWLLLAFVVGLVVGWMTWSRGEDRWFSGWIPWAVAAFAMGLLLAVLRVFADRTGYWLDSALLLTTFYILGCFLGGMWRGRSEPALAHAAVSAPRPVETPPPPPVQRAVAPPPPAPSPPAPEPAAVAPVAAVAGEENLSGSKPKVLAAPRGGKADDLKRIRGIGKQNEGRLHALGVWHFDQIADWTAEEVEWVGGYLAFPGRIEREDWVAQAKVLATGAETEFSKRVDRGAVASSKDGGDKGQGNVADLGGLGSGKPKP